MLPALARERSLPFAPFQLEAFREKLVTALLTAASTP
jgi:hypothetical protein